MESNIFNKLHAAGKFSYTANGDPAYKTVAEKSFRWSIDVYAKFSKEQFVEAMKKEHVPDDVIKGYLDSFSLYDETYVG
jgi:hypothetical protein